MIDEKGAIVPQKSWHVFPALEGNHMYCLSGDGPVLELPLADKERISHQASMGRKNPPRSMRLGRVTVDMPAVGQSGFDCHYWDSM
jgi:hypothetical protein